MAEIIAHSAAVMRQQIQHLPATSSAQEKLDDGSVIAVALRREDDRLIIDFTGTSGVHPQNLNATQAIVRSAVLYVMRLMLQQDLPLNEGLLEPVQIICPNSFLNPTFTGDAAQDPAVVGGNVEVSQRLVDTLIKALGLQSCSQGTMNNFLFGGAGFGYYETIAGGSGAGDGQDPDRGGHAIVSRPCRHFGREDSPTPTRRCVLRVGVFLPQPAAPRHPGLAPVIAGSGLSMPRSRTFATASVAFAVSMLAALCHPGCAGQQRRLRGTGNPLRITRFVGCALRSGEAEGSVRGWRA
jgi:hypothetical protein